MPIAPRPAASPSHPDPPEDLTGAYRAVRERTLELAAPLSPEDCCVQSMTEASPVKWHLAHTTWFFETFVLEAADGGYRPFHPRFRYLFNSYYNAVGEQYPRPLRGLLTRPRLEEVLEYRASVDQRLLGLLDKGKLAPALSQVAVLGLNHEQQHQELMLTDVKHLLASNPLRPVYRDCPAPPPSAPEPVRWHGFGEGLHEIGHQGLGFAFDNECPRHRTFLDGFELASRPATSGEYLAFLEDGGYRRPELWLSDGFDAAQARGWSEPIYWEKRDGEWLEMTLSGLRRLCPDTPVCHLSFYEADAFARWSGARLPTEAEWEVAAAAVAAGPVAMAGNFVEDGLLHPAPAPPGAPAGSAAPRQLFGDVWEWTASPYAPYPGYRSPAGALGEYNGKFMCNQMVLRGGSCVSPRSHLRPTYRNFFAPPTRWQFAGVRLARDLS